MVNRIAEVNQNIILVLVEGRPRVLRNVVGLSRAVINAMLPSRLVVKRVVNPSGRQPITYPASVNNAGCGLRRQSAR